MNQFYKTGSYIIYSRIGMILIALIIVATGVYSSRSTMVLPCLLVFFGALLFLVKSTKTPALAIQIMLVLSFLLLGLNRYIFINRPIGLTIDVLLVITWVVVFLKGFKNVDWTLKNNSLTACWAIWMVYCVIELFNPEVVSSTAWFYAVRSLALYNFLLIPLIFLICNQKRDYKVFINIWFIAAILLSIYGIKQFIYGVDRWEMAWLNAGAIRTHMLWGRLRVFSFLCDAGQFGVFQAQAGTTALIFALKETNKKKLIFYLITSFFSFYGMIISGTRGVLAVPIIGLCLYLVFSKNLKIILGVGLLGALILYQLAFTMRLNKYAPIARMRTAFDQNDPSFQVRKSNREKLDVYLETRPYGGGIGSAGSWGYRFSPDTFLAQFQTDGGYVRIKAETGIVGLTIYLAILILIIIRMGWIVWHQKKGILSNQMIGLTCGVAGVYVANWGNSYSGQIPSCLIIMFCMAYVYMSPKWDKGEEYPLFGTKLPIKKQSKLNIETKMNDVKK